MTNRRIQRICSNMAAAWITVNSAAIKTIAMYAGRDWVDIGCDLFCRANPHTATLAGLKIGGTWKDDPIP